jgi:hypothetical protein
MQQTPEEILTDLKQDIIEDILDRIPEDIDIPIPEITLPEEDLYKDRTDVEDEIISIIMDDLIDRGYAFDSKELTPSIVDDDTYDYEKTGIASIDKVVKLTSNKLTSILKGDDSFSALHANVLKNTVGETVKVRHWGTFTSYEDLTSFNINNGYVDTYKTVNAIKSMTCKGRRIYVALPAEEVDVKFFIDSKESTDMENHRIEVADLGYTTASGKPIPYVIYYTTEYYDTVHLALEMRK